MNKKKVLYTIMIIFFLIMFSLLCLPFGLQITNHIEPHILGLPCYQACILYGSLLMAIAMCVWFLVECKIEDDERRDEEEKEVNDDGR